MKKFALKGFTLLELLVVIAVISGLVGIFVTSYPGIQKRARDTHRKSDLKQYQTSLEAYANKNNGIYPIFTSTSPPLDPSDVTGGADNDVCNDALGLTTDECPEDPKDGKTDCSSGTCRYNYVTNATGTQYALWARLEIPKNTSNPLFIVCSEGRSYEASDTTLPAPGDVCP